MNEPYELRTQFMQTHFFNNTQRSSATSPVSIPIVISGGDLAPPKGLAKCVCHHPYNHLTLPCSFKTKHPTKEVGADLLVQ